MESLTILLALLKRHLSYNQGWCTGYLDPAGKPTIGETTRRLETRLKEHRDDCRKQNLQSSAVADHAWIAHCPLKWEETTIVDRAHTPWEVRVKEAMQIQNLPMDALLNRDRGLETPGC